MSTITHNRFCKFDYIVYILILLSFVFKLWLSSTSPYLNEWDERYHAVVAKNIAINNNFLEPKLYSPYVLNYSPENWTKNEVWLHKQPMTLWIIAVSIKVFGNSVLAVRLPSIIFVSFSILLTYFLAWKLFSKEIGLYSVFLFSINGLTNLLSTGKIATDHVDVYFMFFILMSIFMGIFFSKSRIGILMSGVLLGCAVLVKWLPAYTVILVLGIFYSKDNTVKENLLKITLIVLVSIAIWLPWQIFSYYSYYEEFSVSQEHNYLHLVSYLGEGENPWYYFFYKIPYHYGEVLILGVIYAVYMSVEKNKLNYLALLLWVLIPLAFFTIVKTKMQAYIYFSSPAIFIMISSFLSYFIREIKLSNKIKYILIIVFLISPIVRFFESIQIDRILSEDYYTYDYISNDRLLIFGSKNPMNDMFFMDVAGSYEDVPSQVEIDSLSKIYEIKILE